MMLDVQTHTDDCPDGGPTRRRRVTRLAPGVIAVVLLSVSLLASCGDDDDVSPEDAFCGASDDLRSEIDALADLDLVAEGTNGLEQRLTAINDDLDAMKAAGTDVAADEISTLETAVDELDSALGAAGDELTVDNVTAAVAAVADVGSAAQAVYSTLDTTCS